MDKGPQTALFLLQFIILQVMSCILLLAFALRLRYILQLALPRIKSYTRPYIFRQLLQLSNVLLMVAELIDYMANKNSWKLGNYSKACSMLGIIPISVCTLQIAVVRNEYLQRVPLVREFQLPPPLPSLFLANSPALHDLPVA